MDKKTRILLVIAGILAAFLLFAILRLFSQVKEFPANNIKVEKNENVPENFSCANLTSAYMQETCFTELAIKTGNISFCNSKIYEKGFLASDNWKDSCYFSVINSTGNYSLCSLVEKSETHSPDNCYLNLAFQTKDKNICTKIKDNSTRNYCYGLKMLSER